jgi:hypothetical protein
VDGDGQAHVNNAHEAALALVKKSNRSLPPSLSSAPFLSPDLTHFGKRRERERERERERGSALPKEEAAAARGASRGRTEGRAR